MSDTQVTVINPPQQPISVYRQIKEPTEYNLDVNEFTIGVGLDLGGAAPKRLKPLCVPLSVECFLPPIGDFSPKAHCDFEVYVNQKNLVPKTTWEQKNLKAIGPIKNSETYEAVLASMRSLSRSKEQAQPAQLKALAANGKLPLSPMKLLLYMVAYCKNFVDDLEYLDRAELTVDKLIACAFWNRIFSQTIAVDTVQFCTNNPNCTPSEYVAAKLLGGAVLDINKTETVISSDLVDLSDVRDESFFSDSEALMAEADSWMEIVAVGYVKEDKKILVPLEFLDALCRIKLFESWSSLTQANPAWLQAFAQMLGGDVANPGDYSIVYSIVEQMSSKVWATDKSFNVYKIQHRGVPNLLPVIEEIDVRPPLWMRDANYLAMERMLSHKQLTILSDKFKGAQSVQELDSLGFEIRRATAQNFEIQKHIQELNREMQNAGWRVVDLKSELNLTDLEASKLVQERTYVNEVRVRHKETVSYSWSERRYETVADWFYPRTYRRSSYRRSHTWEEVRREIKTVKEEVPFSKVDWRPLDTYLSNKLNSKIYTSFAEDGTELADQTAATKEYLKGIFGKDADQIANGEKDVRTFSIGLDGEYRDQFGWTLENVLKEAESETVRARLLLLIPQFSQRVDGTKKTFKYLAVHNPMAPRRRYFEPKFYFLETYRHEVGQVPGHYLGPISYSLCLFPGESRTLKMYTETKHSTIRKQDQRSSSRYATESKSSFKQQVRTDIEDSLKETESEKTGVSGGGGFSVGGCGASASASNESLSETIQGNVTKKLNDTINESANSVSNANEVQFSASSETSESSVSTSEQVVTFQNINQGRAVTHKFFQILHHYESKLFIEGIKLLVEFPEPLIPGTDILSRRVYEFEDLLNKDLFFTQILHEEREKLIEAILGILEKRVSKMDPKIGYANANQKVTVGTNRCEIKAAKSQWYVNSGATFIESEIANGTATEPYIDQARDAEVKLQMAKAKRVIDEAESIRKGNIVIPSDAKELQLTILETSNGKQELAAVAK